MAGIILGMGSANERRRYIVMPPLIGWAHIQIPAMDGKEMDGVHPMKYLPRGAFQKHLWALKSKSSYIFTCE